MRQLLSVLPVLFWLISLAEISAATYEIDSSSSFLEIIPGMPADPNNPTSEPVAAGTRMACIYSVVEQVPGSLRAFLSGQLDVIMKGNVVTIVPGNVIDALPNPLGPFLPLPATVGSSGIEDNFGGTGGFGLSFPDAAVRDAMVTISGTLTKGQVAIGLETEFVAGVLDYDAFFLGSDSIGLTPNDGYLESFASTSDSGTLQVSPDGNQITLPVHFDVAWDATGFSCTDGSLPERLTLEAYCCRQSSPCKW